MRATRPSFAVTRDSGALRWCIAIVVRPTLMRAYVLHREMARCWGKREFLVLGHLLLDSHRGRHVCGSVPIAGDKARRESAWRTLILFSDMSAGIVAGAG